MPNFMPHNTRNSTLNPSPQDHDGGVDDEPQGDFHDARQEPPINDNSDPHQFNVLFKRKNANVKRRVTMLINAIKPMEKNPNFLGHNDDILMLRKYLAAADNALDALNTCIDDQVESMDQDDLQPYIDQASDHIPTIIDLRARINVLHSALASDNLVTRTLRADPQPAPKIDNTFKPEPLEPSATPPMFELWKDQFMIYIQRNNLQNAPLKQQRILLNKCLSPAMMSMVSKVCDVQDSTPIDQVMDAIYTQITGSNNLMTRRFRYFNCLQKPGESLREYIVRFRDIGDYAKFESFSYPDNMACRLVTGVVDKDLRRELMRLPNQDFKSIQAFALAWEDSGTNATEVDSGTHASSSAALDVQKVSAYKSNRKSSFHKAQSKDTDRSPSQPSPNQRSASNQKNVSCIYCGYTHPSRPCPAKNQQCSYCKKMGHFARVCKTGLYHKKIHSAHPKVNEISTDDTNLPDMSCEGDEFHTDNQDHVNVVDCSIFNVAANEPEPTPRLTVSFQYRGDTRTHRALPDTGAVVSMLPSSLVSTWDWTKYLQPPHSTLRSVRGVRIECDGVLDVKVSVYGRDLLVSFFVSPEVANVILSWKVLRDLGVISPRFPADLQSSQVSQISTTFDLFKESMIRKYPSVFNASFSLPPMHGTPMNIRLSDNIDWNNIKYTHKPRPVPIPLRNAAKKQIDDMLAKNIITPVAEPTKFLSPMLVVPKKNNSVRLVIDYTEVNKHIIRPVHPFPSVQEVKAMIPSSSKYFATFDAVQGYWQVPLNQESQLLTAFITPWGRYQFTRAPMGLSSSGDEYCRRGDEAFIGVPNVIKVVDDLLIHATTLEQLKISINDVLQAAKNHAISLSPDKFTIGQCVSFVGLSITCGGIRPDKKHVQAIAEFPVPRNKTDLRSFLGLVNQFASFSKDISAASRPLRPLLSAQSTWEWSQEHSVAFDNVRSILVSTPVLQYFDPTKPTKLLTDASRLNGLGFALMQQQCDQKWVLIACGSRFLSSTESGYAVCELEALAIVWSIQKCRIYLMGLPSFVVETDHRPLVTIFNSSRFIRNDNPRLVRLMQKITMYNFVVQWVPGRLHRIPDALSRSPISTNVPDHDIAAVDLDVQAIHHSSDLSLQALSTEASSCSQYQDLRQCILDNDVLSIKKLPVSTHGHVRLFASIYDRLSIHHPTGLVLLDSYRIVVPRSARKGILQLAHISHQGVTRTKARLQSLYFWHGMSNDIVQLVQACNSCQQLRDKQPTQPVMPPSMPSSPFEATSIDLFEYRGSHTITYVDRYSGWPLVAHFSKSPSSSQIIHVLSAFFSDFGIPNAIRHDGAKPLVSHEFKMFLADNHIIDELSSAYHPESNGHAEASVKAIKLLVKKCWMTRQLDRLKFDMALLEWRNTPRLPGAKSPAEIIFHKKLRTLLPAITYDILPSQDIKTAVSRNYAALSNAYDKLNCSRKKALSPLKAGDEVRIFNAINNRWDKLGIITSIRPGGLSYYLRSEGRVLLRGRRLLKKI